MTRLVFTLIIFLLVCSSADLAHSQTFLPDQKTGEKYYKEEKYDKAIQNWLPLADKGLADAQLSMGRLHTQGLGVPKDYKTALTYFRKSAAQGNPKAQFEIGNAYQKGYGVPKDIESAKQWYLLSGKNGYLRSYERLSEIDPGFVLSYPKNKPSKKYSFKSSIKTQLIVDGNSDLSPSNHTETAAIIEAKLTGKYDISENIRALSQFRAIQSNGTAISNYDDDNNTRDQSFIELRQAWVEFRSIFDLPTISTKIGRQRFKEEKGLWWNRDLDALRLNLNSTLTSGFLALGENFGKHRLGNDNTLEESEKKRLRFLGEFLHHYLSNSTIEGRFLYEHDHSNREKIGQTILNRDRDNSDYNLLWAGLRFKGVLNNKQEKAIHYRSDLIGVFGKEKTTGTQTGPTADTRTVSSLNNRDVLGWAYDGGLEISLPFKTTLNIAYAYGSGDNGSSTNHAFRQTGLDSNTSHSPNNSTLGTLRHYGEVLRPELSNIHILNTGINIPIFKSSDLNLNYFSYWRAEDSSNVPSNGIDRNLTAQGNHIGQAFDLITNIDLKNELNLENLVFEDTLLRIKMGTFLSGNAYSGFKDEIAYKGTVELGVKF